MAFAGLNYLAVVVAAVVAWLAGAGWYMVFGKPWMAALGLTEAMIKGKDNKPSPVPFVLAFIADLVMAWVLAGLIGHLGVGQVTIVPFVLVADIEKDGLLVLEVRFDFVERVFRVLGRGRD